jgi:N utilization substance protein A
MNGEVLRIVDSIHRDKNIDKEIVFQGIEMALLSAAKKFFPDTDEVAITIDRDTGSVSASHNGQPLAPEVLGRIPAQTAKQIIIQKIREAERDSQYEEYATRAGEIVHGTVQRQEGGAVTINLGKTEGILPRSEQIPGESHHVGERIRAVIVDVRKTNQRVKIILSRTHPDFVRRLFELEIPEIAERIIDIKALAREAGYRSKVAVVSIDTKVDCVGACVGVRGTRIKNIVDELAGERIDIVRWNESVQVMIPNALQPAEVEDVMLFPMLGRAIVLVKEDQLSLAIGRRGQNVRLASKLVGWDIEIMTSEELDEQIERAVGLFGSIPNIEGALVDRFVEQGFLSFDDLSIMEPETLAQLEGLDVVKATEIVQFAEVEAERMPKESPRKSRAEAVIATETPEGPATEPKTPTESIETAPASPTVGDVGDGDGSAGTPAQPGEVGGDNGEPFTASDEKPAEEAGTSPADESH